ncbi:PaaX family transcriptional regulator C-terminal domain-containing protein [Tateyamaria sp.]|uniref:PaaX family transcriptional regulator C-terminal domain-containing protein n=1 Tax=Tateyamaria sp. TaxID=1929288 RepID=UPI00329ADB1D
MNTDTHTEAIKTLSALGSLRVWSLLVTVFGDLAPDCPLQGPTLSAIMERIGVKPEATRVALHRLRSDDWIASEKTGRTSLHRLTEKGQRDSQAAHLRIYGTPAQMGQGAEVFVIRDTDAIPKNTIYAQISARTFITTTGTPLPEGAMRLTATDFPQWLGPQIEPPALLDAYADLNAALSDILATLPEVTALSPLDVAVVRVMIVHAWRRLALRHPDLPRSAHSAKWRGHDCRVLVAQLLSKYPRPALDQVKAA